MLTTPGALRSLYPISANRANHAAHLRATIPPAMPTKFSRREFWNGDPERLPDGFTVTKPKGDQVLTAVCESGHTKWAGNCGCRSTGKGC